MRDLDSIAIRSRAVVVAVMIFGRRGKSNNWIEEIAGKCDHQWPDDRRRPLEQSLSLVEEK
ncbi:hypothetical protein TIFTF001_051324 [Ficus carica]|uniref:Uncharacterized protein n=1 Tax=Ficus carica TaxID=3494 RepID=A0AA87YUZ2_FICCA|nr:hypothetical protein TIFTF001_051324 [Ficus carica]